MAPSPRIGLAGVLLLGLLLMVIARHAPAEDPAPGPGPPWSPAPRATVTSTATATPTHTPFPTQRPTTTPFPPSGTIVVEVGECRDWPAGSEVPVHLSNGQTGEMHDLLGTYIAGQIVVTSAPVGEWDMDWSGQSYWWPQTVRVWDGMTTIVEYWKCEEQHE
jgi:hypothetical protein